MKKCARCTPMDSMEKFETDCFIASLLVKSIVTLNPQENNYSPE